MPYAGEEVFMFVILPRERFGLAQVLANLTGPKLLELVQNRTKVEVEVSYKY
jgi:serine protease inhibitor